MIPPLVASTMRWESYAGLKADAGWQEIMELADRISAQ
jgi:hypothetical protein